METDTYSRDTGSRADDGAATLPPDPLTGGDVGFWLRRGERLGRAACWLAATVAAWHKRAAKWRRLPASKPSIGSPPQPG